MTLSADCKVGEKFDTAKKTGSMVLGSGLKVQGNQQGAARTGCSIREGEPGDEGDSKAGRGFISKGAALQYLNKKSKADVVAAVRLSKSPDSWTSLKCQGRSTSQHRAQRDMWPSRGIAAIKVRRQQ